MGRKTPIRDENGQVPLNIASSAAAAGRLDRGHVVEGGVRTGFCISRFISKVKMPGTPSRPMEPAQWLKRALLCDGLLQPDTTRRC